MEDRKGGGERVKVGEREDGGEKMGEREAFFLKCGVTWKKTQP